MTSGAHTLYELMWTWPRNNIRPTIPLVAFSCSAEYLITILNNSDGKIVDLVSGSLVSHQGKMIILSRLQASVSLVLRGTAFQLTEPLILHIKLSIASNRKTPHDFPSISEINHLLKFWLANTASRSITTAAALRCTEYVFDSGIHITALDRYLFGTFL